MTTHDIALLFGGWQLDSEGKLSAVTGPAKLSQRAALILMTAVGSNSLRPEFGSSLLGYARRGLIVGQQAAMLLGVKAANEVLSQLKTAIRSDDPDDEKPVGFTLQSAVVSGRKLTYVFRLTLASGESRSVSLPAIRI